MNSSAKNAFAIGLGVGLALVALFAISYSFAPPVAQEVPLATGLDTATGPSQSTITAAASPAVSSQNVQSTSAISTSQAGGSSVPPPNGTGIDLAPMQNLPGGPQLSVMLFILLTVSAIAAIGFSFGAAQRLK